MHPFGSHSATTPPATASPQSRFLGVSATLTASVSYLLSPQNQASVPAAALTKAVDRPHDTARGGSCSVLRLLEPRVRVPAHPRSSLKSLPPERPGHGHPQFGPLHGRFPAVGPLCSADALGDTVHSLGSDDHSQRPNSKSRTAAGKPRLHPAPRCAPTPSCQHLTHVPRQTQLPVPGLLPTPPGCFSGHHDTHHTAEVWMVSTSLTQGHGHDRTACPPFCPHNYHPHPSTS